MTWEHVLDLSPARARLLVAASVRRDAGMAQTGLAVLAGVLGAAFSKDGQTGLDELRKALERLSETR